MRELTAAEVKEIQLQMLDSVDAFCREHNLRYSLGGGTLLGAIRHKGYIPWDDDIDLMMPRAHYQFLLENYNHSDYSAHYWSPENSGAGRRNWVLPFAKIVHKYSTITEGGIATVEGVNIDIFPVDGVCDELPRLNRHLRYIQKLKALLIHKRPGAKMNLKRIVAMFFTVNYVQKCLNRACCRYSVEDSPLVGSLVGAYGKREVYPRTVFENYTTAQFEDRHYPVIGGWEAYLSQHYGNYMELPPEDKRCAPHSIKAYMNESKEQ